MYNSMYGTFLCLFFEPMGTGGCYDYLLMRGGAHNDVDVVVVGVVVVAPSAELAKTKQSKQKRGEHTKTTITCETMKAKNSEKRKHQSTDTTPATSKAQNTKSRYCMRLLSWCSCKEQQELFHGVLHSTVLYKAPRALATHPEPH